jgi:hypothetical protein
MLFANCIYMVLIHFYFINNDYTFENKKCLNIINAYNTLVCFSPLFSFLILKENDK